MAMVSHQHEETARVRTQSLTGTLHRMRHASSGHQRWEKLGQDGNLSPSFNAENISQLMGGVRLTGHGKMKTQSLGC